MSGRPFPVDPVRTGISIAYKNEELIADQVLPVATPVPRDDFTYLEYPLAQGITVPNMDMGRRSEAPTIEVTATETSSRVKGYALSDLVPNDDIKDAPEGYDPLNHATEVVTDLVLLGRELRTAGLVFNAGTYGSDYKVQLSGDSQWSDVDSDPFTAMWNALEVPLVRPNVAVFGRATWNGMATNPKLITKLYGSGSTRGKARLQDLAEELEIERIIVGAARVNSAQPGQTPVLARAWGKHAALLHINKLANNERGMTFGMTVPGNVRRAVRIIDEPKVGIGGSQRVQVEDKVKELITAANCGYFFQDAVA